MTDPMQKPSHTPDTMDNYWLWRRLTVKGKSYRYFYINKMVRADSVPQWIKNVFEKYSENNIKELPHA